MIDRAHALAAGVFLLALLGAGVGLGVWISDGAEETVPYLVVSSVALPGLKTHSTVTYRGVEAGTVEGLRLDPTDRKNVLVELSVRRSIRLTESAFARLHTKLVTGTTYLVLDDHFTSDVELRTGQEQPGRIPLELGGITEALLTVPELVKDAREAIDRVATLVPRDAPEKVSRILDHLERSAAMMPQLGRDLQRAGNDLPRITGRAARVAARAERFSRQLGPMAEQLRGGTAQFERLMKSAAAAGQGLVGDTVPRLNRALDRLAGMAREVRRTANLLQENPQSLVSGMPALPPGPGERGYDPEARP